MEEYTNDLIHETSPYLLQHAHNPVNWVAWTNEAFERAKKENKLVLISIGYSACHWCHVMEHECFEDEEVAAIMNKFFINIKVDREERPDVDQIYMTAVQLMTQKGGWPLNCFTLPNGKPIYGGTYFPKEHWMYILRSLQETYTNDPDKAREYAENLTEGIQNSELIDQIIPTHTFENKHLDELVLRWSKHFDRQYGGDSKAPKFPLPDNYQFLQAYGYVANHENVLKHVDLTLKSMAFGGIYDQIRGGFSRYSVDLLWKVPHFEKMLYDNGQLLSLYAQAYKRTKENLYREVVEDTIQWLEDEMRSPFGCFFSAIDADSENEEGKFYVWTKEELSTLLKKDEQWLFDYYNVNQLGAWEGNYILMRNLSDEKFAQQHGLRIDDLKEQVKSIQRRLLNTRNERIKPGIDDKCLSSWNAMTGKGLLDAYLAFQNEHFLNLAKGIQLWLEKYMLAENGKIYRNFKDGKANIDGFLEDYAFVIEFYIALFQATLEEKHLDQAKKILEFTLHHFSHEKQVMFYFTPENTDLIARKMEINDNVIPSSNAVMAMNLFTLGSYFAHEAWMNRAKQMVNAMYDGMEHYGSGYSHWAQLLLKFTHQHHAIVISGKDEKEKYFELAKEYLPNILLGISSNNTVPYSNHKKTTEPETVYFWCKHETCFEPTTDIDSILNRIYV